MHDAYLALFLNELLSGAWASSACKHTRITGGIPPTKRSTNSWCVTAHVYFRSRLPNSTRAHTRSAAYGVSSRDHVHTRTRSCSLGARLLEVGDQCLIGHAVYSYLVRSVPICFSHHSQLLQCLTQQQLGHIHHFSRKANMVPHRTSTCKTSRLRASCSL